MKREPKKLSVTVVLVSVVSAVTCWREGMKKSEREGGTSGVEVEKVQ